MSEFKGTKGAWRARNGLETVDVEMPGDVIHDIGKIEDAWLIAAAPDLLKALQGMVTAAENIGGESVYGLMELDNHADMARIAIDKALGK